MNLLNAPWFIRVFCFCRPLGRKSRLLLECTSFVQSRGGEALTAILDFTWQNLSWVEKCNYFIFTSSSPLHALALMSWMKARYVFGLFFRNKILCVPPRKLCGKNIAQGSGCKPRAKLQIISSVFWATVNAFQLGNNEQFCDICLKILMNKVLQIFLGFFTFG